VVDAARTAIAQEFQIAERLDAKARNQVTVGGVWFALVQAVASVAIKNEIDAGRTTWLFALLVVVALVAGACLVMTIVLSYDVWRLRDEVEITNESLEEMSEVARNPQDDLLDKMVAHYGFVLWTRRSNNKNRAQSFQNSIPWWMAALIAGLAKLVIAVAVLAQA
jgi:hypothetical protein